MTLLNEKKEGERFIGFFLVKERDLKIATNGSEYLSFVLTDREQTISAKLWDVTAEQKEVLHRKAVVKIDGVVTLYRNQKQLTIQRIRLATEDDPIKVSDLIPHAKVSREELWHDLRLFIDEIESPVLTKLIKALLSKKEIRDALTTMPADTRLHHSYYAGLLEHVITLCHGAMQLLPLYPHVNKDHVLATCILHDIGKARALTDPIAPEYTITGEFIGAVVLAIEMINEAAQEAGIEVTNHEIVAVKHCILAQQQQADRDWKGTVPGKTPAAVFFFYLDKIDTNMNALLQTYDSERKDWRYSPLLKRHVFTTDLEALD